MWYIKQLLEDELGVLGRGKRTNYMAAEQSELYNPIDDNDNDDNDDYCLFHQTFTIV